MDRKISLSKKNFRLSVLWAVVALFMVLSNVKFLWPAYRHHLSKSKDFSLPAPGDEFNDFKIFLKNVKRVGFLTNKYMSAEHNDGMFLKAQFALAPVVLDLDNTNERFLIIDTPNILSAMEFTQSLKAEFVHVNIHSKILAERK